MSGYDTNIINNDGDGAIIEKERLGNVKENRASGISFWSSKVLSESGGSANFLSCIS